jgi:hypothetical protein
MQTNYSTDKAPAWAVEKKHIKEYTKGVPLISSALNYGFYYL